MKKEVRDYGPWKLSTSSSNLSGNGEEWTGTVVTEFGLVRADAERGELWLQIIWQRRTWVRLIRGYKPTRRGIVRMAKRFAREVAEANP